MRFVLFLAFFSVFFFRFFFRFLFFRCCFFSTSFSNFPPRRSSSTPIQHNKTISFLLRYLVWAPGNCASVRLALQLASDSLVLKIDSSGEEEWYYPLLKPFEHYVPIAANETYVGVAEGVAWAEARPREARAVVLAANAFAEKFLSARGRYCYAAQLLSEFVSRYEGGSEGVVMLPEGAEAVPGVADRPELEEPE